MLSLKLVLKLLQTWILLAVLQQTSQTVTQALQIQINYQSPKQN